MNIMEEEKALAEVMSLLEVEPAPAALPAALPAANIPDLREQLAILVSTGKCKEAIGVSLTHEQVRRLDEKRCNEALQKVRDLRWRQDN